MTSTLAVWLQNDGSNAAGAVFGGVMMLFWLAVMVVVIIGGWKMFEKAGQPGWAILIPFYNLYIMLKIAGRPGWWLLLYLIPLVNLVIAIIVAIDIAKAFGQSAVFGFFLLFLLGGIGYLILGFGNYRYQGPAAAAA
jgi:Ca2+/Na+ antiporter